MPLISDQLSIWDISFRWAGFDPDKLWFKYPLAVKDNFKLLMHAVLHGEVICNTLCLDKILQGSGLAKQHFEKSQGWTKKSFEELQKKKPHMYESKRRCF